jgi:DNA-binding response OmpR family regulator
MIQILLVEDDPALGTGLKLNLEYEGYQVTWARDLRSAQRENGERQFDLTLLDLGLPDGNGITFCTQVREGGSRMPIIMLTAQSDEESVVKGLMAGANDYMRKPFGNKELIARIITVLREPKVREDQLRFENLVVLRSQRKVMYGPHEIEFSRREFDLLALMVENGDNVVTRERLLNMMDREGEILDRTMDSHFSHIRSKLRRAGVTTLQIASVYGVGYRLEKA